MTASCMFPLHQGTLHASTRNGLQACLASAHSWMSTNKLKLNPDKTEFLLIRNERLPSKYLSMFPIELLGVKTNRAKSVWNLGVIFDKDFPFRSHILAVCTSCFYHLRDLRAFAVPLIWIVQHYLQLVLCSVVSIIAIHFLWYHRHWPHTASVVQNRMAHLVTMFPPFSRALHCFVPFIGCQ